MLCTFHTREDTTSWGNEKGTVVIPTVVNGVLLWLTRLKAFINTDSYMKPGRRDVYGGRRKVDASWGVIVLVVVVVVERSTR